MRVSSISILVFGCCLLFGCGGDESLPWFGQSAKGENGDSVSFNKTLVIQNNAGVLSLLINGTVTEQRSFSVSALTCPDGREQCNVQIHAVASIENAMLPFSVCWGLDSAPTCYDGNPQAFGKAATVYDGSRSLDLKLSLIRSSLGDNSSLTINWSGSWYHDEASFGDQRQDPYQYDDQQNPPYPYDPQSEVIYGTACVLGGSCGNQHLWCNSQSGTCEPCPDYLINVDQISGPFAEESCETQDDNDPPTYVHACDTCMVGECCHQGSCFIGKLNGWQCDDGEARCYGCPDGHVCRAEGEICSFGTTCSNNLCSGGKGDSDSEFPEPQPYEGKG